MSRANSTPRGCTFLAKVGFDFISGNELYLAALQIVITTVKHLACLRKFLEISLHNIPHKFVGGRSAILGRKVAEPLFRLGSEVDFHAFKIPEMCQRVKHERSQMPHASIRNAHNFLVVFRSSK